jgi:hypothetical protein
MRVKKVDLIAPNQPRQAESRRQVEGIAKAELVPSDRQVGQSRAEWGALPNCQVERMATLDQRAGQIRNVTLSPSHLLSGTDLQNLHPGDPEK